MTSETTPAEEEKFTIPSGSLGGDISNAFDIYVRMNDDAERDYCFSVNKKGENR